MMPVTGVIIGFICGIICGIRVNKALDAKKIYPIIIWIGAMLICAGIEIFSFVKLTS